MSFNQGTSENQPSTPFIPGPAPVAPVARMVPEAADGEQAAVAPPGPAAMMAPASASAAPFPIDPALTATPAGLGQGSAAQAYSQAQMQVATTAPVPTVQNVAAAHVTIAPAPAPPTAPSQELVPYNHAPQTGTPSDATSTAAAGHAQVDITQLPAVHPKAPPNPLNNFRNAAPSYHLPDGSVVFPGGEVRMSSILPCFVIFSTFPSALFLLVSSPLTSFDPPMRSAVDAFTYPFQTPKSCAQALHVWVRFNAKSIQMIYISWDLLSYLYQSCTAGPWLSPSASSCHRAAVRPRTKPRLVLM